MQLAEVVLKTAGVLGEVQFTESSRSQWCRDVSETRSLMAAYSIFVHVNCDTPLKFHFVIRRDGGGEGEG